jgi:hypothetical protein
LSFIFSLVFADALDTLCAAALDLYLNCWVLSAAAQTTIKFNPRNKMILVEYLNESSQLG